MKSNQPVFCCDAPGCRSTCTLELGEPNPNSALVLRGWSVQSTPDEHYCPAHAGVIRRGTKEPTDLE